MLLLKNPDNSSSFPWQEIVLADGPDIAIELGPLTSQGQVIFAAEFFGMFIVTFSCFSVLKLRH